jgi:hypothetical protein
VHSSTPTSHPVMVEVGCRAGIGAAGTVGG